MFSSNVLVSVVVPIYNVEKYLNKCVESIVNQTYKNIEIILIDDGSPDKCPEICDNWAERDNRIKVIHKENQGLGMARNTGIEHATGEYICFFDSDDYFALDTIEKCVQGTKDYNADAVWFGLVDVDSSGIFLRKPNLKINQLHYIDKDITKLFLPELISHDYRNGEAHNYAFSSCTCMLSLSLIKENDLYFKSEKSMISEDSFFLLQFFSKVNSVLVLPELLYFHFVNTESLTRSYRADRSEKNLFFLKESILLSDKLEYSSTIKNRIISLYHSFTIDTLKQLISSDIADKKEKIKNILKDRCLRDTLKYNILVTEKKIIKIFFLCAKLRMYNLCYLMLKIKMG